MGSIQIYSDFSNTEVRTDNFLSSDAIVLGSKILLIFNVLTFLFQFIVDLLPPTFIKRFQVIKKNFKNVNLRNRNDFHIPRVKSIKIGLLPSHNFPTICK